ncbi:MAG: MoxR family ATPase [Candidatus Nanoarchaeia archaeon]|jgi:hypothetical protein
MSNKKIASIFDAELFGYFNTAKVITFGGQPMYLFDIIKACLISKSNLLLLGGTGLGKTTLAKSIGDSFFNGEMNQLRMNKEANLKEVYENFNPKADELIAINRSITSNLITFIDEFNRAPELIQNDLFNIMDGYYNFKGRREQLGRDGYHIIIAAANPYNDDYSGTFNTDEALLNRFPVVINMDYFEPTPKDTTQILLKRSNDEKNDLSESIINEWKKVKGTIKDVNYLKDTTLELITTQYLIHGLDYCEKHKVSKKGITIRDCEGCNNMGGFCAVTNKANPRIKRVYQDLFPAFIKVFEHITGEEYKLDGTNTFYDFFEVLKLVAPYNGIIKDEVINSRFKGNPYDASNLILNAIRTEVYENKNLINEALRSDKKLLDGRLSFVNQLRW